MTKLVLMVRARRFYFPRLRTSQSPTRALRLRSAIFSIIPAARQSCHSKMCDLPFCYLDFATTKITAIGNCENASLN